MEDGIYFDGAADPNPGHAAFGFSHRERGEEVAFQCGYIGHATNNVAEYVGLLNCLLYCNVHSIRDVKIFGDSQLVVNQLNGKYKVKNQNLKTLCDSCRQLSSELNVAVEWIPREKNERADYLSKLPLREKEYKINETFQCCNVSQGVYAGVHATAAIRRAA